MVSKRLATALGTGTLGAGGAGAAAWNFGLFGGNGLGVNVDNAAGKQLNGVTPSSPGGPQEGAVQESATGNGGRGEGAGGGGIAGPIFQGATDLDKKAIDSSSNQDWSSVVSVSGGISVVINNGNDTSNLWSCRLEAVILESSNISDRSEFERQGKELVEKIKANDDQRKKFVENCSKARTGNEQSDGGASKIYLETEKTTGSKFKFKDRDLVDLLDRDFTGVYKLGDDEEQVMSSMSWEIAVDKEDQKKVIVSTKYNIIDYEKNTSTPADWNCSISGKPNDKKVFSDESLKRILGTFGESGIMVEKKKYILRNCMKNNKDIKGLEFKEEGGSWRLEEESLKKITEGMYENPAGEKP